MKFYHLIVRKNIKVAQQMSNCKAVMHQIQFRLTALRQGKEKGRYGEWDMVEKGRKGRVKEGEGAERGHPWFCYTPLYEILDKILWMATVPNSFCSVLCHCYVLVLGIYLVLFAAVKVRGG